MKFGYALLGLVALTSLHVSSGERSFEGIWKVFPNLKKKNPGAFPRIAVNCLWKLYRMIPSYCEVYLLGTVVWFLTNQMLWLDNALCFT